MNGPANISGNAYLGKKQIFQVVVFVVLVYWLLALLYHAKLVPAGYILTGVITVVLFYTLHRYLNQAWGSLPEKKFLLRLLGTGLLLRLAVALFLYFFYKYQTGEPFEYYAVDSKFYHLVATRLSRQIAQFNFNFGETLKDIGFSDRGYNIFLGFVYYIFGPSIITVRILNAILSAFSLILIYRLARDLYGEKIAKSASLAALLVPNLMLYLGTHLKETVMVFLVLLFLSGTIRFIKLGKRGPLLIIALLFTGFTLFMFRTILGAVCLMSFAGYALTIKPFRRGWINMLASGILLAGLGYIMLNSEIGNELAEYLEKSKTSQQENMQFRATRDGGNKFALMASAPLFVSIILIAPFPSVVVVPEQDLLWMFIGGNTIRNIYALFVIGALVWIIRREFRNGSILVYYLFGYLLVLANSGFAISERFHIPAVPVLMILAALGMEKASPGLKRFFPIYLFLVLLFIVGWNYVKLAGRT